MKAYSIHNLYQTKRPGALAVGILAGLPVTCLSLFALPASAQNPCPGIYYEEPHNSTRLVPQGCPPNAATQRLIDQGQISGERYLRENLSSNTQLRPISQPSAIATVIPIAGKVTVLLKNDTNTQVFYQVVGYTERRFLEANSSANLQNLPTPFTVVMTRQDRGFLKVTPVRSSEPGSIAVSLDEASDFNQSRSALQIRANGQVEAN